MARLLLWLLLGAAGCGGVGVSRVGQPLDGGGGGALDVGGEDDGDSAAGADFCLCEAAQARLGHRACVCRIPDATVWKSITTPLGSPFELRATKYSLPARDDARLPTVFVDSNAFSLHYDFMRESFPDLFGALTTRDYLAMIQDARQRELFAGDITEYVLGGQAVLYGFSIVDNPADPATTTTCEQARAAYATLDAHIDLVPLAFVPTTANQRQAISGCDIASYDPRKGVDYEAYTQGVGYGTLRRFTLAELATATQSHGFGWQDILVLAEAPTDIEAVVSGAVTGTQQGALSHLNVRSAARGTPNCYLNRAYDLLQAWEGMLVRLECGNGFFAIEAATEEAAAAYWQTLRPPAIAIPEPDRTWTAPLGLLDLPTGTPELRASAVSRFGAKGANLATLYQRIEPRYQLPGFLVPVSAYLDFVDTHGFTVDLGGGPAYHSFAETLAGWLADPLFRSDGREREKRLSALRSAMAGTSVDVDLTSAIRSVFGTDTRMLRFRSSSNAEDALGFSGAGLYDSYSGCLADDLDGDQSGPSSCDASEAKEHTVARALVRVWASLWNAAAYDEREWYGIDHRQAAMAVLVDPRATGELANIVAFSGNPTAPGDDRYLVDAQAGELDVVLPDPGVFPEESLLTMAGGVVTGISRMHGSSELSAGQWVLADAQLEQLGGLLWQIVQVYPVDGAVPPGATVLLDTEWKILSDGSLVVKQVRPFLRK
jgi:pyruvate, water dikinase